MLNRLFPKQADSAYRGHWLGIAALIVVMLLKGTQGVGVLVATRKTLVQADGIPVDSFPPGAAATVLGMFALLGMYTLLMPVLSAIILIRWLALVPFALFLFLVIQAGARLVQTFYVIPRSTDPDTNFAGHPIGFWINMAILAVTIIGLLLSLMDRRRKAAVGAT